MAASDPKGPADSVRAHAEEQGMTWSSTRKFGVFCFLLFSCACELICAHSNFHFDNDPETLCSVSLLLSNFVDCCSFGGSLVMIEFCS